MIGLKKDLKSPVPSVHCAMRKHLSLQMSTCAMLLAFSACLGCRPSPAPSPSPSPSLSGSPSLTPSASSAASAAPLPAPDEYVVLVTDPLALQQIEARGGSLGALLDGAAGGSNDVLATHP